MSPLALKAINLLVDDTKAVSVLTLDAFAHNRFVTPTEPELRAFWTQIEEAVKAILAAEPPAANVDPQ